MNLAKVAIGVAAAISHWRFRNIDHRLVLQLAIPGCLGALIGVTVLANVDGDDHRADPRRDADPRRAADPLALPPRPVAISPAEADDFAHDPDRMPDFDQRGVKVAATAGGVTNGLIGAWGPIVTPFLLHRGLTPRFAIGSVNTAEVAVAVDLRRRAHRVARRRERRDRRHHRDARRRRAGGPLAAWVVRHVPAQPIGLAVGALLLLTNARVLAEWADLGSFRWLVYAGAVALVAAASLAPRLANGSTDDA